MKISKYSLNVLTLMTGTTIAQAITMVFTPVLTRIYTPEDFGTFALYASISAMLAVIITGRYEMAVMLPHDDADAVNVLALSILLTTTLSIIFGITILLFGSQIVQLFGNDELEKWLFLIPVSVFFLGSYQSFNYWANRRKGFASVSISKVAQSGTAVSSKLAFGAFQYGTSGLVYGELLGQGISSFILGYKNKTSLKKNIGHIKLKQIKRVAHKYRKFPRINLPHAFLNVFSSQTPIILINYFFTSGIAGFYSLANKILMLPMSIITSSYAQVFYEQISSSANSDSPGEVASLFKKTLSRLMLYSFPIFILLFIFIQSLVTIIFGDVWEEAGLYAMILIPMLYFRFTGSVVSSVVLVFNRQGKALVIEILNTVLRVVALIIGGIENSILTGLFLYSASSSVITIYRLVWYWSIVKENR